MHHYTNFVNGTPLPTVDDILRYFPPPADMEHLIPVMRRLPHFLILCDIGEQCAKYNKPPEDFEALLIATAALFDEPVRRCAGCLSWASYYHAAYFDQDETFVMAPLCDPCYQRIDAGKPTRRMKHNLHSYAGVTL